MSKLRVRAIFDGKPKLIEVARTTLSLKSVETAIQKAFFLLNKPVSIKYIRVDGSTLDVQSTDHLLEAVKDAEAAGVQFFQLYAARKDPAEPLAQPSPVENLSPAVARISPKVEPAAPVPQPISQVQTSSRIRSGTAPVQPIQTPPSPVVPQSSVAIPSTPPAQASHTICHVCGSKNVGKFCVECGAPQRHATVVSSPATARAVTPAATTPVAVTPTRPAVTPIATTPVAAVTPTRPTVTPVVTTPVTSVASPVASRHSVGVVTTPIYTPAPTVVQPVPLTPPAATPNDDGKYPLILPTWNRSIAYCTHCKDQITDIGVKALERYWHKKCFHCATCKKPFQDLKFKNVNGRFLCETCYYNQHGLQCTLCAQNITSNYLMVDGRPFHKQCYKK